MSFYGILKIIGRCAFGSRWSYFNLESWLIAVWRSLFGAGALVERDGHVLMVLHNRSGKMRWELPSGFVEPGESLEQAASRETLEETAIPVVVHSLLCTVVMEVPSETYRGINAYFCAVETGHEIPQPELSENITRAEFVDLSAIRSRDIHPVDREILARWRRRKRQGSFYFRIVLS